MGKVLVSHWLDMLYTHVSHRPLARDETRTSTQMFMISPSAPESMTCLTARL